MRRHPTGRIELPSAVFAHGFSLRKRPFVRRFVGPVKVRFIRHGNQAEPGSALLLWGSTPAPSGLSPDVMIVRLEDGFLRSVGLGADLIPPVSWVIDRRGMYYDSARPSDLEHMLQNAEFSPELLERAGRLQKRIVESGLTKYNVGHNGWKRPGRSGQRVILVPGQVETDASVRFGAPGIRTNVDLLQAVRETDPAAYVVYKPHPDVVAGLRAEGRGDSGVRRWCDEVVTDVSMNDMLTAVDEVHVLTSLTGFEGLLRGRGVTCYGQPFYSGWGLTSDIVPVDRRTRRLSLSMLVAGALILYPTYVSRTTGRALAPEEAVDELVAWRESNGAGLPWWRRAFRPFLRRMVHRPQPSPKRERGI
ncbi:MAG: capsular polysaccharide export protein, LipB/KpsS family [Nitrospirota bacterium]